MGTIVVLILSAAKELIALAATYRKKAQQAGEWTPEDETKYLAERDRITSQDHWKIES